MYLDLFIIILIMYALWNGWHNGLLRELVSMLGFIGGLIIACLFYSTLGKYLTTSGSEVTIITSIIAFLIIWIIVPIAMGTIATLLTKALKHIHLLSTSNKFAGMLISGAKYLLLMSLVINVMASLNILNHTRIEGSHLFTPITSVTEILSHSVLESARPKVVEHDTIQQNDTVWIDVKH